MTLEIKMRKLLFVDCCIRNEDVSRTKKLCRAYLDEYLANHPGTQIEHLYLPDEPLKWIDEKTADRRAELNRKRDYTDEMFRWARQYCEADRIVIGAPYWDLSIPSLLKVYIENVSVVQLTFYCDAEGLHGKCKADWMLHLATRGSLWEGDWLQDSAYLKQMCSFFGVKNYYSVSANGIDIGGLPAEEILEKALKKTEEVCRNL